MRGQTRAQVKYSVRVRLLSVWIVSSAVPMAGLLAINFGRHIGLIPTPIGKVDWVTVVIAMIGLAAGTRVVLLVGGVLADPLDELAKAMDKVSRGDIDADVAVYDTSELGVLQHGFNQMVGGLQERQRVRDLFARHVGSTVAEHALAGDDEMSGGTTPSVGVLFVDIAGSTMMGEHLDPEVVAGLLNRFFTIVADVVDEHEGFINKFEGDAALAVFGAPVALDNAAAAALRRRRANWPVGCGRNCRSGGDRGVPRDGVRRGHRCPAPIRVHRDRRSGQRVRPAVRSRQRRQGACRGQRRSGERRGGRGTQLGLPRLVAPARPPR